MTDDETLIFLHLMKTGGTSLFRLIRQHYPDNVVFHYVPKKAGKTLQDLQDLGAEKRNQLKFVHGHTQFGFHQHFTQLSRYITLLREPIDRVVSLYYFTHRNPNREVPDDQDYPTIKSYFETQRKALNNYQTREIAGAAAADFAFGECTEELLAIAKQNLEQFLMVGITERFDASVIVLRQLLNLDTVLYVRANENSDRPLLDELDPSDIDHIANYNQLDQKLYAYANQLLDERIQEMGDKFQAELYLFQQANRQFNEVRTRLMNTRQELDSVRIELGQAYKDLEKERSITFSQRVRCKLYQMLNPLQSSELD
ncbi:MAG: sulfotransferase family 2 domain-containing protein [Leptolyngbyaceae cyanobacterium]